MYCYQQHRIYYELLKSVSKFPPIDFRRLVFCSCLSVDLEGKSIKYNLPINNIHEISITLRRITVKISNKSRSLKYVMIEYLKNLEQIKRYFARFIYELFDGIQSLLQTNPHSQNQ